MAKFRLDYDEELIGKEYIAYQDPYGLGGSEELGIVYVTTRRLLHRTITGVVFVDLPLSDITGVKLIKRFFSRPKCNIYTHQGEIHTFADFAVEELTYWLEDAGITRYK